MSDAPAIVNKLKSRGIYVAVHRHTKMHGVYDRRNIDYIAPLGTSSYAYTPPDKYRVEMLLVKHWEPVCEIILSVRVYSHAVLPRPQGPGPAGLLLAAPRRPRSGSATRCAALSPRSNG